MVYGFVLMMALLLASDSFAAGANLAGCEGDLKASTAGRFFLSPDLALDPEKVVQHFDWIHPSFPRAAATYIDPSVPVTPIAIRRSASDGKVVLIVRYFDRVEYHQAFIPEVDGTFAGAQIENLDVLGPGEYVRAGYVFVRSHDGDLLSINNRLLNHLDAHQRALNLGHGETVTGLYGLMKIDGDRVRIEYQVFDRVDYSGREVDFELSPEDFPELRSLNPGERLWLYNVRQR